MNLNNFTLKAQESFQQASNIAESKGQQALECAHLLRGIISEAEGICEFIFGKMGVSIQPLIRDLEKLISSYPKVTGAETYISPSVSEAVRKANKYASEMKDKYIQQNILFWEYLTPLMMCLMYLRSWVTLKALKAAIEELRKGATVDSQTADDTFNSLNRYAINLNERAHSGKLDPLWEEMKKSEEYFRYWNAVQKIIL
jgi:ATP-dependent Clp protease ATP-binding subunit ClpB